MKKISLLLSSIFLLIAAPALAAHSNNRNSTSVLAAGTTINQDYFAAAGVTQLSGTINGDAYLAGGQVEVDGTINGDLLAAGGTITVSGKVTGSLRVAGGTVIVSGDVGRNITVAGGSVEITRAANVHGSLLAAGGNVTINGPIGTNIKVGSGNVTINGPIGGNVEAGVSQLHLAAGADIKGNLTYLSNNDLTKDSGAKVAGTITKRTPPQRQVNHGFVVFFKLAQLLSLLLIGLILLKLFPGFTNRAGQQLKASPWTALGLGFAALILVPIAVILLGITLIGLPLGLIVLALYLIDLYLAPIIVAIEGGELLTKSLGSDTGRYLAFVIGIVLYWLLTLVPIIGPLVVFISILLGLGAIVRAKRDYWVKSQA